MTGADLVNRVVDQAGIDVNRTEALVWIQQRADELVGRSEWRRQRQSLGDTAAGTAAYVIPDGVYEVLRVTVDGSGEYTRQSEDTIFDLIDGTANLQGEGGVFAPYHDDQGAEMLQLYPVPTADGQAIVALCAMKAPTIHDDDTELAWLPSEFHPVPADAAIGDGYDLMDHRPDLAQPEWQKFEAKVIELTQLKNARLIRGPHKLLVKGTDW